MKHMNLLIDSFEFGVLTQIHYGVGKLNELPDILKAENYQKVMIVTDPGLANSGLLERLEKILTSGEIQYAVFKEVQPDPTLEVVDTVRQLFLDNQCDAVIGIGGGSSIDTAKGVSAAVANPGELGQYEGKNKLPK
jgi:alcohol dehydrogenase class IV